MVMATSNEPLERVTFRWETEETFGSADPAGRPYSWDATPLTSVSHPDVQIDCVVEFSARPAGSRDTALGQFDTARAVITILDEDIDSVRGADAVIINGNVYDIQLEGPAIGMFDAGVYQLFCEARDES